MKKYLLIVGLFIIFLVGLYLWVTKKEDLSIKTSEYQITQLLSKKNNWEASRVELKITRVEGNFAKGEVKLKGETGGGLWFAARVNEAWEIVYDGNGIITCDQLVNYKNFPKDLIPSCFDKQMEKLLIR